MYEQLTSWQNLYQAYRAASRGKRGKAGVAAFEYALEDNLLGLQQDLRSRGYGPGGYVSFVIHEPKRRVISAAPFRDRVAHHALCNVIEPVFERTFIHGSYANRVGKGTHRALDRCQYYARRFRYVLACDIRQFFPSIDHAILFGIIAAKITDEQVLWLVSQILSSGVGLLDKEYEMVYFPGDDLLAAIRPRGLPIGNLTSQFWANVYLNSFDHFVKRELRCKAYIRYVDDFLLFADDKLTLWDWLAAIKQRLQRLRLTLHLSVEPRPVGEGVSFLGFRVFTQRRRLKRRKGIFFQRKFRRMVQAYERGEGELEQVTTSVAGWVNYVRYGNTVGLRKAVLSQRVIGKRSHSQKPSNGGNHLIGSGDL